MFLKLLGNCSGHNPQIDGLHCHSSALHGSIILLVGSRPCEGDPLFAAIVVETLVDELAAVVRIQSQKRKGQSSAYAVYPRPYSVLAFTPYSHTLRPAAGYIYCAQGSQIESFSALAAMGYQIYLHESRPVLLPVGEGPDRYRALKKAPRPCSSSVLPPSELSIGP